MPQGKLEGNGGRNTLEKHRGKDGPEICRQFAGRFSKWHVTEASTNPLTY